MRLHGAEPRLFLGLQAGVANTVRRLFPELKIVEEYEDARSGYSIDLRVSGAGGVRAVEVDGPWHFLKGGSGREPSGSTLLKRRQLAQLGYTAVAVPYWEWNDLMGKGDEELRRYLHDKLRIDQDAPSSHIPDVEGRNLAETAPEPCGTGSGKQTTRMDTRAPRDELRSLLEEGQPGRPVSLADLDSWIARNGRKEEGGRLS
ncbi:hypothetical protein T484DRAFT_2396244 [Baffinella frigidus]|nr:hypothetical protein T484DRAFT_2396244 [Cryptophyta sp. CCMP2293]